MFLFLESERAQSLTCSFDYDLSVNRHQELGFSRSTRRCSERNQLTLIFSWFVMIQTYSSGLLSSRCVLVTLAQPNERTLLNYFLPTLSLIFTRDPRRLLMKVVSSSLPLLFQSNTLCYLPKFASWLKFSIQMFISRLFLFLAKSTFSYEDHFFLSFLSIKTIHFAISKILLGCKWWSLE